MSQLSLQKRWKWSQNKVKRFLNMLKKHGMADFETNDLTTIITICNFDTYQTDERTGERPNGRADGRPVERYADDQSNDDIRKKESKERENGKKTTLPTAVDKTDEDYRFAEWMLSLITEQQPDFKTPDLAKWSNTIRLMRERDNRNHKDMGRVWKWVRLDDFWSPNVMSADKFRKQYDRLYAMSNKPTRQDSKEQQRQQMIDKRNIELGITQPQQGIFIDGEVTRHD
jgi:hypothetical protein